MQIYFILRNNTDFYYDLQEVDKKQRQKCKETDVFMLIKKVLDKDYCENIAKIYTVNTISEVSKIVKNAKVYDYTGIDTIIRIGEQVMTFNQYKSCKQ